MHQKFRVSNQDSDCIQTDKRLKTREFNKYNTPALRWSPHLDNLIKLSEGTSVCKKISRAEIMDGVYAALGIEGYKETKKLLHLEDCYDLQTIPTDFFGVIEQDHYLVWDLAEQKLVEMNYECNHIINRPNKDFHTNLFYFPKALFVRYTSVNIMEDFYWKECSGGYVRINAKTCKEVKSKKFEDNFRSYKWFTGSETIGRDKFYTGDAELETTIPELIKKLSGEYSGQANIICADGIEAIFKIGGETEHQERMTTLHLGIRVPLFISPISWNEDNLTDYQKGFMKAFNNKNNEMNLDI